MLRVVALSTLFPDASRPNFGVFVEHQTLGLAARDDVALTVVAPIGLPPGPAIGRYAALATLPLVEDWKGVVVHRPRFVVWPFTRGRFHARAVERAVIAVLDSLAGGFDVIDASFFFPDGPAAVALGQRYDVPVSIKARGADIHHWGRAPATAAQVLAAGRGADGLLAVSQAMKADMVALGMPAAQISVHHTGVDLAAFAPADRIAGKAGFGVVGPMVASVGALIPRKGHDVTIEAVARLPGVSLLIAGEGPERARLAALIDRLGVGDRVRLLGAIPHADLPRLFAAADVMALASSSEGLANVWVESLACGTPIVITDAGGAREVVTDATAGRVAARTPGPFAAAIAVLLADPPASEIVRRHAMGFTWAANTEALHAHLLALVAAHQASG